MRLFQLLILISLPILLTGCPGSWEEDDDTTGDDDDVTGDDDTTGGQDEDSDGHFTPDDCDDGDPSIYPGAPEQCDGVDNDCDGSPGADEADDDADGFRICEGDCNDGTNAVYPGASQLCDGFPDNDCDGADDVNEVDGDGDGYTGCSGDCDDAAADVHPQATELCDGLDNDCDGSPDPDEDDADGDGVRGCDGDCDDADPDVSPGATEVCDNGSDDDCDGNTDCGDGDCTGDPACTVWTVLYCQDFANQTVFDEGIVGNQTFSDGAEWWDAGLFSHLGYGSGHPDYGMNIYKEAISAEHSALQLIIPAPAADTQTLRVTFWAYNPNVTDEAIRLARAGGTPIELTVPSQNWTYFEELLTSAMSSSDAMIQVGAIPCCTGSFNMRLDEICVEVD